MTPLVRAALTLAQSEALTIAVAEGPTVSALLQVPAGAQSCYVMAHGAGAGMTHPFMTAFAGDLAARSIATLRYQFPYMEKGSRRPDPPKVAHATVRAAVGEASRRLPDLPLFAGGRSFGGRMTSQAQAASPLLGVSGLAFLGFPLHPAREPDDARGKHLAEVRIPMLFVQGTRDDLAHLSLVEPLIARLAPRATLELLPDADHSFHVPARTGRKDPEVRAQAADALARWIAALRSRELT